MRKAQVESRGYYGGTSSNRERVPRTPREDRCHWGFAGLPRLKHRHMVERRWDSGTPGQGLRSNMRDPDRQPWVSLVTMAIGRGVERDEVVQRGLSVRLGLGLCRMKGHQHTALVPQAWVQ